MKLPLVSGNDVLKLLQKECFVAVVPLKQEIKKGTLLSIIKQAGMTREEFLSKL